MSRSCYDVLKITEDACAYDIREAYIVKSKQDTNVEQIEETFEAYTLAMELCMYKPFFETTCDDVDKLVDEREACVLNEVSL